MSKAKEDVYCTLLMSDSYLPGAAVLSHSLRDCGTKKKLAILITVDSLLYNTLTELRKLFDYVIPVDKIANPNLENLSRLGRLDLRFAFTKIALWKQEQFRKIVYVDADVVALRAPDELFDLDSPFAAAPDIGWPDIFNSGVMALTPNMGEYLSLETLAASGTSFDGADQGLLNEYYAGRPWHRLSFTYNCTPSSSYQYEPAYRHFRSNISMTHFIGKEKPWQTGRGAVSASGSGSYKELAGKWWAVYDRHYKLRKTSALGQVQSPDRVVQAYVNDVDQDSAISWATEGQRPTTPAPPPPTPAIPPESQAVSTQSMGDSKGVRESADENHTQSKRESFEAPQSWDATRSEPPQHSKPEAGGFEGRHYSMSEDKGLYQAPSSFPEPPRESLHYQLPTSQPKPAEKPKPIFPWESSAKKPTRVFADQPPAPAPEPAPEPTPQTQEVAQQTSTRPNRAPSGPTSPPAEIKPPSEPVSESAPLSSFTRVANAWDNTPSIDSYVRAVKTAQAQRGKIQVLHHTAPSTSSSIDLGSPTSENLPEIPGSTTTPSKRRESLILTDFPTEIERPSLPVTPAPIRKTTFWGVSRDAASDLPSAEGVPEQADWDPVASLEKLRRNSLIRTEEQLAPVELPRRELPASSAFAVTGAGSPLRERGSLASDPSTLADAAPGPVLEDVHAGAQKVKLADGPLSPAPASPPVLASPPLVSQAAAPSISPSTRETVARAVLGEGTPLNSTSSLASTSASTAASTSATAAGIGEVGAGAASSS